MVVGGRVPLCYSPAPASSKRCHVFLYGTLWLLRLGSLAIWTTEYFCEWLLAPASFPVISPIIGILHRLFESPHRYNRYMYGCASLGPRSNWYCRGYASRVL